MGVCNVLFIYFYLDCNVVGGAGGGGGGGGWG